MFMLLFDDGMAAFRLDAEPMAGETIVDSEAVDRAPGEYETFDWTTRDFVYRDPADVQVMLLAKVDAARLARLGHAEWLIGQFNNSLGKRAQAYLQRLRYDEGRAYLALPEAAKAALTTSETESLFPLLSITAYSLDYGYFGAEANAALGGEGYAKNFVVLIEQVAKDAIANITAASTATDKIAAFDAIVWPLPAGQTLP